MLEAEEVDDDYFTPVASATLANIFGKKSVTDEEKENESLKYTPSKPENVKQKLEESKATTCIFACALIGYEWSNNSYTTKGKLGFAILKLLKTGFHNIILYDSKKTTLSCTSISPKLEVTIKGNFISYYDNLAKYWSIYATVDEIKKIVEFLNCFNVSVKSLPCTDIDPPKPLKLEKPSLESPHQSHKPYHQYEKKDVESDTDSSINRKTKVSILSRMANMGHSVLPTNTISALKTSDSSDTNESNNHTKSFRHKSVKTLVKRNNTEKNISIDSRNIVDTQNRVNYPIIEQSVEYKNMPTFAFANEQMVPLANTSIITSSGNNSGSDIHFFISEQRISNSELRINMNRITDKVDHVLDKINNLECKDKNNVATSLQTEILQKLLTEYESKIKVYEEILISKGIDDMKLKSVIGGIPNTLKTENEVGLLKDTISELEQVVKVKNDKISKIQNEIKRLTNEYSEKTHRIKQNENNLQIKIKELEQELLIKNEKLESLNKKFEMLSVHNQEDQHCDIENNIKNIMNDTFQAISVNFDSNEMYSGEGIRSIIAVIIKKVTIESLSK